MACRGAIDLLPDQNAVDPVSLRTISVSTLLASRFDNTRRRLLG